MFSLAKNSSVAPALYVNNYSCSGYNSNDFTRMNKTYYSWKGCLNFINKVVVFILVITLFT